MGYKISWQKIPSLLTYVQTNLETAVINNETKMFPF